MEEILRLALTKQQNEDAEELRRSVLQKAFRYVEYRFRWELYTREEKIENDSSRSIAHNSFMDSVNIYIRYLNKIGGTEYPNFEGRDRKACGDLACRIVCETAISNR